LAAFYPALKGWAIVRFIPLLTELNQFLENVFPQMCRADGAFNSCSTTLRENSAQDRSPSSAVKHNFSLPAVWGEYPIDKMKPVFAFSPFAQLKLKSHES
jgi:hypothetical protein